MIGAVAGNSSGHNFTALRDKIIENDRVLIIDLTLESVQNRQNFFLWKNFFWGGREGLSPLDIAMVILLS